MALAAPTSASADWPERQVKLIVTFPPGSANDAAARIFADALGKKWGKPVVVEDRPGAEGTIGVAAFVASQDDHTLLYSVAGSVTVAPLLVEKLPYDANHDLVPISATTAIVLMLTVSNQLSVNSIPELIEAFNKLGIPLEEQGELFRRYRSQPVGALIAKINPKLRGWVNYFRIGNASR